MAVHHTELTSCQYLALWEQSNCRNEEQAWSFLVRRDYIESHLKDIETDRQNGHDPPEYYEWLKKLHQHLADAGEVALFVINDSVFEG